MTGQAKSAVDTLLAEALKELAEKHPIEKITIKEITDRAGVIRPTFYNHFQDKYELLEWIIMEDLLKPMIPLIKNGMLDQAGIFLFTSIEREKNFYSKFSRLEGQNSFEVIIKGCAKKALLQIFSEEGAVEPIKYSWLTPELVAEYYAQSLCFVILTWIQGGMAVEPKKLAEIYDYIMKHSLEDVIIEMKQK